jgi:DNA-binding MarR family transcriptional regulator
MTVQDTSPADVSAEELDALLAAARALVAVAIASVVELEDQLPLTQFRALVVLVEEGPINATVLAGKLAINPSSVTRLADRLIADGLLRRAQNPLNRREVLLAPTTRGRRTVDRVMARRRADLAKILGELSATDRTATATALRRFADAAARFPTPPLPAGWPFA